MKAKLIVWDKKKNKPLDETDSNALLKEETDGQTVSIEEHNKALDKIKALEAELEELKAGFEAAPVGEAKEDAAKGAKNKKDSKKE